MGRPQIPRLSRELALDFRAKGGGIAARVGLTNCLLIPTRKTPTGSGQRAIAFSRAGSVDDREDGCATMRGRLAAAVLVFAEHRHGAAEDHRSAGEREAAERPPFSEPARERRRTDSWRRRRSGPACDGVEDGAEAGGLRDGVAALVIAVGGQAECGAGLRLREAVPLAPAA